MSRQVDGSPMPPLKVVTAVTKRPKSAGTFTSTNRRLISAAGLHNSPRAELPPTNQHPIQQRRPKSSRYPRPPSTSGSNSPRPRPCSAAMQLWRQAGTPRTTTGHNSIVQRVMREEIDEQRRVTLDAQRQRHELQAAIVRRQEELQLAQRHLQAFDPSSVSSVLSTSSVSSAKSATALTAVAKSATLLSKPKPPSNDVVANLKNDVAHQDAYKKRLRYMYERLARELQFLEANTDLLAERRKSASRERSLCRSQATLESDKIRHTQRQLRELQGKRTAFQRNALPVLESYRDELASRLVMAQRRQDADRRREELLKFIGSKPNGDSSVTTRSLTSATAAIRKECTPIGRLQRRDSYNILAADAEENKRETLFAVYEGQYARVLRETGEVDLNLVLERFQSYRESTVRLREIEIELRAEGARLTREQQAHRAMVSRLRVSGPADIVERRQRVRDRLEGALHAQQLEKTQTRERVATQLKAFVYVQQGVLHIVELLQCLEDRPSLSLSPPASVLAVARTVMGGNQPAEVALKSVAPALQSLVHLSKDVGYRGLQREWFKLPALGYSVPQVARLEQFVPECQMNHGSFGTDEDLDERMESGSSEAKDNKYEVDEELRDMRRNIKKQEKETLHQAEIILRQASDARKLQQQQPQKKSPQQLQMHLQSDADIVAAHFREQRRAERQEQRFMNGNTAASLFSRRRSSGSNFNNGALTIGAQKFRRRQPPPPSNPN